MLAARLSLDTLEFGVKEVPLPEPQPGWVRVKVRAAGVCLSDLHLIKGDQTGLHLTSGEITLGHEIAGEVDLFGPGVEGWSPGDRVALSLLHNRPDGEYTIGLDFDGGWAEYVVTPASTLVRIPDSLPFDIAAIVPDAVSTPWAAITQTAQVKAGEAVGVWGVGGVGTHAIQLLRFVGAAPIIAVDPIEEARGRALRLGADFVIDPTTEDAAEQIKNLTMGRGVDVAFDFVGISAVQAQLLQAAAPLGRAVFVGVNAEPFVLDMPALLLVMRQQIRGHFASGPDAIPDLLRLLALGRLDFSESISGHYSLRDTAMAVESLDKKTDNPVRLVIVP
ncbi:zinc-binding dehydrogenase [Streptomyces mirabilis]|uniref:zinc-binding dehydrogenase n=1 Tax=Streptomyces mirabilis TaxID=68239 RepID=UPI00365FA37D